MNSLSNATEINFVINVGNSGYFEFHFLTTEDTEDTEKSKMILYLAKPHQKRKRHFIHTLGMERGRLARIINKLNARFARFLVWKNDAYQKQMVTITFVPLCVLCG